MPCRGLFITGTDTGVGKTHVAAGIVHLLSGQGIRVGAYKPTASGSERGPNGPVWNDVEQLCAALGGEFPRDAVCPQRWHAPLAPPLAAREEGKVVDSSLLRQGAMWWRERVDLLVVEGVGGLLSPMTDTETVADLAVDLGFPLIVVARTSLGTINHTLLTLEGARTRQLPIAGVILNQACPPDPDDRSTRTNPAELAVRMSPPLIVVLPYAPLSDLLQNAAFRKIDFAGLAAVGN